MSDQHGPPPRWGPLTPQRWPQDDNRVPGVSGFNQMPPVSAANAQRARRESFTVSGSWTITPANVAGQVLPLYLATDPDGDFWCDQIGIVAWSTLFAPQTRPMPSLVSISDARTGRALTYPDNVPTNFFTSLQLYSDDAGFDPASSPFPDGFRSTSTIAQPFCFTRAGGIQLYLTLLAPTFGGATVTIDIGFNGWKEYASAST